MITKPIYVQWIKISKRSPSAEKRRATIKHLRKMQDVADADHLPIRYQAVFNDEGTEYVVIPVYMPVQGRLELTGGRMNRMLTMEERTRWLGKE